MSLDHYEYAPQAQHSQQNVKVMPSPSGGEVCKQCGRMKSENVPDSRRDGDWSSTSCSACFDWSQVGYTGCPPFDPDWESKMPWHFLSIHFCFGNGWKTPSSPFWNAVQSWKESSSASCKTLEWLSSLVSLSPNATWENTITGLLALKWTRTFEKSHSSPRMALSAVSSCSTISRINKQSLIGN